MWDGSQKVVELQEDDLMEELSDYLLAQGDLSSALRMMMQRGMRGKPLLGLQDLLQRLRTRRQQHLDQYNLNSVVDEMKKKLDEVVSTEREGIQKRVDETRRRADEARPRATPPQDATDASTPQSQAQAQPSSGMSGDGATPPSGDQQQDLSPEMAEQLLKMLEKQAADKAQFLQNLPKDMPGALKQLQEYEFMDPDAKQKFDELMELIKQQVMDSLFNQMQQRLSDMSPDQMQQMREMIQDLNQMLKERFREASRTSTRSWTSIGTCSGRMRRRTLMSCSSACSSRCRKCRV